jgi:hypothetical protein
MARHKNTNCYYSFVGLGYPGRHFVTEDPKPHDLLPADDAAWDNGVRLPNTINFQVAYFAHRWSLPMIFVPYLHLQAVI